MPRNSADLHMFTHQGRTPFVRAEWRERCENRRTLVVKAARRLQTPPEERDATPRVLFVSNDWRGERTFNL
jgi:hypothetical protein